MSFVFSLGYRSPISSVALNQKLHEIWGRNGVLSGFIISRHLNTEVKIEGNGAAVINGVKVTYTEDNPGNPLRIGIPLDTDGKKYIYGLYNHKLQAFTLHTTDGKYDAIGEWKVFLGHAEVVGGAILNIQSIIEPSSQQITELDAIYRRMPNMDELINFFYETSDSLGDQIDNIVNDKIGNLATLKTEHKTSVVGSINEIFDTKEPTLSRDRILELLGNGTDGGNIDIDSINGIPVKDFVLKGRAVNTGPDSGLRGGGDLSMDRALSIDWGRSEFKVPKGNHNHSGFHLDKRFDNVLGIDKGSAVYSQLAYFAQDKKDTGAVKITLPKGFTNANLAIELKGYDNGVGTSAYTVQLGGRTNKVSNSWEVCSANILGTSPFTKVKFGKDAAGKACIILGDSSTVWTKYSLYISQVIASGEGSGDWESGWHIEVISGELVGIEIQETPKLTTGGPQEGEFVPPNTAVKAGTGLLGGGSLSNDVTISADFGTGYNHIARGDHGHTNYVTKSGWAGKNIMATDSQGNIAATGVSSDYLPYLNNLSGNIQSQLNDKASSGHGHNNYFPKSGGSMEGSVNMHGHWFNSDNCNINGVRVSVGANQPNPVGWGHIWIQLV